MAGGLNEKWRSRVLEILQELIRIDTVNPPGNETKAARYLRTLLTSAGVEAQIIESAPGRGNLIARLRGSGGARPLMLMGHLDVVAADPAEWSHPPFAAEIHDGFIWGRGSTDMKQMVAISTVILLALAEQVGHDRSLKRDVVLLATADEEHGGRQGMGWLVRERREWFDVACAINEGGGTPLRVGGRLFFTCQTAEKGVCRTVWVAQSKGGHGAYPREDMASLKLARAVARLGDGHLSGRVTETMSRALSIIARATSEQATRRVEKLLTKGKVEAALQAAGFAQEDLGRYRALFYDTASLTVLRAGDPQSINVIPPTATAYVDGRLLPGQTQAGFLELLRTRGGDEVSIEPYNNQFSPGLESSGDAPIVEIMGEVIAECCPGAAVVPWMCAGSTDAKHLVPIGVPVYGFIPAKPFPDGVEGAGAHAVDERLWLESLYFGLDVLYEVVYRFCMRV
ncbi:MAG: M20/M25/M40 family metallo-hydrolase [Chloroflexi bacterium]|nr:M20/M25/M40 family metallo-hydrolase [Chloroflexota bacterium]